MSLRTGGGVTTSYSGNDDAALVLGPEGSRRRRGYEFVAPRRPEPGAVELLELALVGGVVPLELVNDSNDEVPLPPALAKVGDTLSEVECGVSRDARAPLTTRSTGTMRCAIHLSSVGTLTRMTFAAWLLLIVSSRSRRRPSMIGSSSCRTSPPLRAVRCSARIRLQSVRC